MRSPSVFGPVCWIWLIHVLGVKSRRMHYSPRCTVNRVVTMAILTGAGHEDDLTSVIYSLNSLEILDGSPYCQKRIGGLFIHAAVRYTVCVNVLCESGQYELAAGCRTDMALLS